MSLMDTVNTAIKMLDTSVTNALIASRIVGKRNSYSSDNPKESKLVFAYLKGGTRPATVATAMGKMLLGLEDARRTLYVAPPTGGNYGRGFYGSEVYGR